LSQCDLKEKASFQKIIFLSAFLISKDTIKKNINEHLIRLLLTFIICRFTETADQSLIIIRLFLVYVVTKGDGNQSRSTGWNSSSGNPIGNNWHGLNISSSQEPQWDSEEEVYTALNKMV
jgi:hypothetical protein